MSAREPRPVTVAVPPHLAQFLRHHYDEVISFNVLLGLKALEVHPDHARAQLTMRPELVGHRPTHRIHGGAISAAIDVTGSLAVMAAIAVRHPQDTTEQLFERITKIGTINMHVDYLRPGIGDRFLLQSQIVRLGSRVATARVDFMGEDGKLLSSGSAAYIVS
jgi:uncharacterized protein (TIGR00369 family)